MTKVAIVTGASRGIGYQTCRSLARRGHRVVAVARSKKPLKDLEDEFPGIVSAEPADLTDADELAALVANVENTFTRIHCLVNNAGALINKPFEDLNTDDWRYLLEVNLLSAVNLTRRLLPLFAENAHIVNISSMGGFQGSAKFPGLTAYSVSKGGLSILSECLAAELSDKSISANTLCPGAVHTEMFEQAFPGIDAPVSAEKMGNYIADFALEGSTLYNGQVLPVTLGNPE